MYCGSVESLTDEHIAPKGLQGEDILGDATCSKCQKFTTYIESRTLLGFLRPIREHHGIVNKKRRTKRPPYYVYFDNGDGSSERVQVSKDDYPLHLVMPILAPPGILAGPQRNAGFPNPIDVKSYVDDQSIAIQRKLIDSDRLKRKLTTNFDFGNFTKLLAKIAYCYAYFFMNEAFEPLILDLLHSAREDSSLGPYFVGSTFAQIGVSYPDYRPNNLFWAQVRSSKIGKIPYVITRIALFDHFQMPHYDVVVGRI